jgi:uncharacterized SAM-binding protein YcdF (DUF218 family)
MHALLFWLLTNPLVVFLGLIGLAIVNLWRKRTETRLRLLAVTVPYLFLVMFSTPACVYFFRGLLEWQYPPLKERPEEVEAIVVLASAVQADTDSPTGFVLDVHSHSRCQCAAEMFRKGKPCPVLVTGGRPTPEVPACSAVMRDYLVELGVPSANIVVEDYSSDTYENAVEARRILDERGMHRVLLITDASHLPRAVGCFRKQGIDTMACGCRYLSTPSSEGRLMFWPHPVALQTCSMVCYEWLALPWYWIRGRS